MSKSTVSKTVALLMIFSIAGLARAAEDASSFIAVKVVKCSEDGEGNSWNDIVVSNTHKFQAIRVSIEWISVAREFGKDVNLKPGQQKTIAQDQQNAREVRVAEARFK